MRNLKSLLAIFALSLFVFSCKKEKGPDLADKNLYIPVDIGHQYHYEVDSSYWTTDSSGVIKFEYRETYETDVPDNTGGLQTRIKIERKGDVNSGFGLVGYAYIQKYYNKNNKEYTIERTQNNIKYVLLHTPIVNGDSINRNAKNFGMPDFWSAAHIENSYSIPGNTYQHTLTLTNKSYEDSVYYISSKEVYAHGVGLIYKEDIYLKGRTDVSNWQNVPIEQRIENGYKCIKTLKSHVDLY